MTTLTRPPFLFVIATYESMRNTGCDELIRKVQPHVTFVPVDAERADFLPRVPHLNPDGSITREWMLGHAHPEAVEVVTIHRYRLGSDLHALGPLRLAYGYKAEGGLRRDYGPGLESVRRFVRRNFPNASVVETWH